MSISVVRDTAKYIGIAVANLATAIDPEVVVLGGPAAAYGDLLIEPVRRVATPRTGIVPPSPPAAGGHIPGEDAVATGAARMASDPGR